MLYQWVFLMGQHDSWFGILGDTFTTVTCDSIVHLLSLPSHWQSKGKIMHIHPVVGY